MKTLMITVANYPDNPEWFKIIQDNRREYCKLGTEPLVLESVPVQFTHLGPSKVRIPLILSALEQGYDRVMWIDADAVLLNTIHEEELPDDLAFAHDAGGINDGITVTVKRNVPMWKMVMVLMLSHLYMDNPISAQRILQDMNPIHTILALDLWNSRWWSGYAKIIHFAGEADRFAKIKEAYNKRRGL